MMRAPISDYVKVSHVIIPVQILIQMISPGRDRANDSRSDNKEEPSLGISFSTFVRELKII